jgi:hypothetical protein
MAVHSLTYTRFEDTFAAKSESALQTVPVLPGFVCVDNTREPSTSTIELSEAALREKLLAELPLLAENGIVLDAHVRSGDISSKTLYFGVGLCTTKEMSVGIPVDFLGLIATAEAIRRVLGFGKIIQLIADSHAKSNHFVSDEEVDKKAREFKELSLKIAKNSGLEGKYEVILASDIDSSSEYKEILASISVDGIHEYARREWTDMEYLARNYNTCLKVSWMMPLKKGQTHRSDEVFFDEGYKARFKRPYSFIYNRAALTFDPARLNVSPYSSARGEKRLYLTTDQDAEIKLAEFLAVKHKAKERALEQLEKIVSFFQRMFKAGTTEGSIGSRVNSIVKAVLQ